MCQVMTLHLLRLCGCFQLLTFLSRLPVPSLANNPIPSLSKSHISNLSQHLPLRLLPALELLQNANNLLQAGEPGIELLVDALLVVAQVGVEGLAVGRGAHGGGEDGLDHEGVVGLEGVAVGGAEGLGELAGGFGEVVAEALGGEVEASVERDVC